MKFIQRVKEMKTCNGFAAIRALINLEIKFETTN